MVPWWLFAIVVVWAIVETYLHIVRSKLPLPPFDKGSAIFSAISEKAQQVIVTISGRHGLPAIFRADSPLANRMILANGSIVNVPKDDRFKDIGSSFALACNDPLYAAEEAATVLRENGFIALVIPDPDPEMRPNSMVFVETNAFKNTLLVFRVNIGKMPKPQRVRSGDYI
jgi:hypothetical protein